MTETSRRVVTVPETRTFNNPMMVLHYENGELVKRSISHSEGLGNPFGAFPVNEWDMEVTFTRKAKPVEAHTWVETGKRGKEVSVYVLAIHGRMAWVSEDPDGLAGGALTAWTENVSALRRR